MVSMHDNDWNSKVPPSLDTCTVCGWMRCALLGLYCNPTNATRERTHEIPMSPSDVRWIGVRRSKSRGEEMASDDMEIIEVRNRIR